MTQEKRRPNTPIEVLARRRDAATQAVKGIEDAQQACAKTMNQVSKTWEALLDDEQSQRIANELTALEANIAQIRNEMKQLPLEQKNIKTAEMCRLQQQTTTLCAHQQQCEEKVEELQARAEIVTELI